MGRLGFKIAVFLIFSIFLIFLDIFDDFYPSGQVLNHDCLDRNKLKFLGKTKGGAILDHNKLFLESDLMIYVGQVVAHSWGGYTGTGAAIGLASTESIASHHNFHVVDHPETTLGDQKRMYFRKLKAEINDGLEKAINKRISKRISKWTRK